MFNARPTHLTTIVFPAEHFGAVQVYLARNVVNINHMLN